MAASERPDWPGVPGLTADFLAAEDIDISVVLRGIGLSQSRIDTGIRALEWVLFTNHDPLFKFRLQHVNEFARGLKLREEGLGRLEEAAFVPLILAFLGRGAGALSTFTHVDLTYTEDNLDMTYLEGLKSFPHLDVDSAASLCANLGHQSSKVHSLCLRGQRVFGAGKGCEMLGQALISNRCLKELYLSSTGLGSEGVKLLASGLKENHTLEHLNIGDNHGIGDKGTGYVAELLVDPNMPLKFLGLSGIGMGLGGLQVLSAALSRNTTLQELSIGTDLITREDVVGLLGVLTYGSLTGTSIELGNMHEVHFPVASMIARNMYRSLTCLGLTGEWVEDFIPARHQTSTLKQLHLRQIRFPEFAIDNAIRALEEVGFNSDSPLTFRLQHVAQFVRALRLEYDRSEWLKASIVALLLALVGRGAGVLSTFTGVDMTYTNSLDMTDLTGLKSIPVLDEDSATSLCANLGHQSSKVHSLCLSGQKVFGAGKGCEMLGQALISNRCLKELYLTSTGLGSEGVKLLACGLKENHTLEHLYMGDNHGIGDEGTGYVAELLVGNMSLKFLGLSGIGMGLQGVKALSAALSRNATLQDLSMGTDLITREDVVDLLRVLIYTNLTGNSIELGSMHEVHFPVASMIARNMYKSLTCLGLTGEWVEDFIPARHQTSTLKQLHLRQIRFPEFAIDTAIRALEEVGFNSDSPLTFRLQHVAQFVRALRLEYDRSEWLKASIVALLLALVGRGAGVLSTFTGVDMTYTNSLDMTNLTGLKSIPVLDEDSAMSLCANLGHQSSKVHSLFLSGQKVFGVGKGCEMLAQALRSNRCLKELYLTSTGLGSEGVKLLASGLKENQTLERLDIGLNPGIGDEGAGYVAELLVGNMSLKFLGLSGTGMGLQGVKALSAALSRNTTLQDLSIGTDLITREDVVDLLRMLIYTNLTGNSIELGSMHEVHFPVASMIARNMYKSLTYLGLTGEWVEDFIPARHQTSTLKQLHLRQIRFPEFAIDTAIRALEEEVGFNSPFTFRLQHVAQFVRALRLEYDRSEWLKASIVALLLALVGRGAGVLSTVTGVDMTYTRYPKYTKDNLDLSHLEGLKSFPHLDEDSAASLCANLGHQSSKVHSLCLSGQKVFGVGKGCEMLAQALRSNRCLKELYLPRTGLGSEGVKLLVSALEENHTLERLDIGLNPGIGDEEAGYVAERLVGNMSLKFLGLSGIGMRLGGVEVLSAALSRNTTLQDLGVGGDPLSKERMDLLLRVRTPAKESLTSIELGNMHISVESLASMIARNRSLTCLSLTDARLSSDEWVEDIIPALGKNATLKELSVRGSNGVTPTSVLEALIDMVDSSETALEVIDVEDTPLSQAGMAGRLTEALRIRKEYGATLKGQSTRTPTCGRLVLCGYEFSGKTTICKTMRRITDGELPPCHGTKMAFRNFFRKHSGWRHFLYGKQASRELEHRTRGYEVVVLRNESHRRSTIWDFAGQEEYYVLHDFILPNARNTYFLFVCSAVYPAYHDPQHLAGQPRTKDDMAKQFLYWLRFLASNAKPGTPPRVIFVLTNKDGLGIRAQHTSTGWANNVVTEMKEKFENVIHLEDRAVVVNAHNFEDIIGLQDLVEERLQDLLAQGPEEFVVCEHVRLALQEWAGNNPSKIFIKKEQFRAICRGKVKQNMGYAEYAISKLATPDGQNAVLAYLNDAGEIICPSTLDFIVVDPTWFGRGVLGSLIDAFDSTSKPGGLLGGFIGYVKDCLPGGSDIWRGLNHEHGFVAYRDVEELLMTSLRTTHLTKIITPEDLIELMIKLDMCYKEKPEVKTSRLFIPAVFDNDEDLAANGKRQLGWKLGRRPGRFHYVGRRLLCRNTTLTLLSPGFFPRLQVVLRNYYHSKGWTENQAFQIDRNLIGFAEDGHEVLVEYSGNIDYFVDILAKSDHTYLRTLQFIREHVMGRIMNFCASPQGCPGVLLVDAVIRPFCVEQLHLCADRIDHAILVSDLEDKLANDDEKACKHIWKKEIQGTDIVNYALDLLEGKDSYKTFNFKRTSTGLQPALIQENFDKVFQWSRLLDNRGHSRTTTSSAPGLQHEGTDDCYDSNVVKGQKRGIAVLISMEKYNSGDRLGGAVDRGRLEALAGSLSLEVIALVDSPAAELREQLMNIQEECVLSEDECFVCFVNAHGNTTHNGEHFIRDKVGHWILLDDIVGPFRTCQKLRGKPKMFVVNSCRGRNIVAGAEAPGPSSDQAGAEAPGPSSDQRPYQQSNEGNEYRYVEDLSDCLVAFSTSGGSVSARDPMSGTSFVAALVEAFNSKRHNTDVLNIIRSVNCAVVHKDNYWVDEHGNERPVKQCPIVVTSLTKRFFLR